MTGGKDLDVVNIAGADYVSLGNGNDALGSSASIGQALMGDGKDTVNIKGAGSVSLGAGETTRWWQTGSWPPSMPVRAMIF